MWSEVAKVSNLYWEGARSHCQTKGSVPRVCFEIVQWERAKTSECADSPVKTGAGDVRASGLNLPPKRGGNAI